jgi:hypothetical protein
MPVSPPAMTVMPPINVLGYRRLAGKQLERIHVAAHRSCICNPGSKNHRDGREGDTQRSLHEASLLGYERRFDAK